MMSRFLILAFLFFNISSFGQWKSFYPEQNKNKSQSPKKGKNGNDILNYNNIFFSALKQKSLENYEASLSLFEKCIDKNNSLTEAYYQASIIHKKLNNLIVAKEYSLRTVKASNSNIWYIRNYAEILFLNQDFEESARQYISILDMEPENEFNYYKLADAYIYNQQYIKAIRVYDKLEQKKGINKMISMQKHKLYLQLKNVKKATQELELLSKKNPKDLEILQILAEAYILNNNKEKAFDIFKKISDSDPDNGRVHLTLANFHRDNGDVESSFYELKKAFRSKQISIDTKISILSSYNGIISVNDTIKNQAFILAEILLLNYAKDHRVNAIYGDLLLANNNKVKAKTYYKKSININKSTPSVWTQLLFLEIEESNYDSLLQLSEEALSYYPSEPLYYYFYAISNIYFNNYTEALNTLKNGIDYVFDNKRLYSEFQVSLADTYHALERYNSSDSLFDKILLSNPNNIIVLNNYSYYLSLRKKDLKKAKELSKRCNELELNNGTYQDTYAWILYCLGDFENANIWMEKALMNGGGESAVVVEHYGDILFKLGNKKKALIQWKTAKLLGNGSQLLDEKIKNEKILE
jgi:tetratricopeptide (TPR) repeat protein